MRHKYSVPGIVLARSPLSEAGLLITVLTSDLGLIRARAEGVRRSGAKLAPALQTLQESDLTLVRGREGWRVTGALLAEDRFGSLTQDARTRAARVSGLLQRMVQGEAGDPALHEVFMEFLSALTECTGEDADAAESLAVLRILSTLGVDAGELPPEGYGEEALLYVQNNRTALIARINRGITASSL